MDKVLSASQAGFPCMRNLWYTVNGCNGAETDTGTQRIFDVGTALEPVIVDWLRADGWTVEYNPGSQEAALEVVIPIKGGTLTGHPDCIISRGEIQNALVDIKTMNDRAFRFWKREGTQKSKQQYVTQLHIYALGLKQMGREISRLGIVGVNKNNSEMHIDFFEYDEFRAKELVNYAEWLFEQDKPLELGCPSESWACGYCGYSEICGINGSGSREIVGEEELTVTKDEGVIGAMKELKQARDMAKEARDMETHAKTLLDENVKAKGLRGIQGGGLVFTMTERVSTRWDGTAFKKAHPDLAAQYTSEATTTYFTLKEEL